MTREEEYEADLKLGKRATLREYSEDQPRDEQGRWSPGDTAEKSALRDQIRTLQAQHTQATLQARAEHEGGQGDMSRPDKIERELLKSSEKLAKIEKAEEDAHWTKEVTQANRTAWNAAIKNGEATDPKTGKIDGNKLQALSQRLGFNVDQLKGHIARHGL